MTQSGLLRRRSSKDKEAETAEFTKNIKIPIDICIVMCYHYSTSLGVYFFAPFFRPRQNGFKQAKQFFRPCRNAGCGKSKKLIIHPFRGIRRQRRGRLKLFKSKNNRRCRKSESKNYTCVYRVQTAQLQHQEKQEERS